MGVCCAVISMSANSVADNPDLIYMNFEFELSELIQVTAQPEFNLNAQNYEWVVVRAFETLQGNVDQEYLQCEFAVDVIAIIMPQVQLMQQESGYDWISQVLLDTIRKLHLRMIRDDLYLDHRFPYFPARFASQTDIFFERRVAPKPFKFIRHDC